MFLSIVIIIKTVWLLRFAQKYRKTHKIVDSFIICREIYKLLFQKVKTGYSKLNLSTSFHLYCIVYWKEWNFGVGKRFMTITLKMNWWNLLKTIIYYYYYKMLPVVDYGFGWIIQFTLVSLLCAENYKLAKPERYLFAAKFHILYTVLYWIVLSSPVEAVCVRGKCFRKQCHSHLTMNIQEPLLQ